MHEYSLVHSLLRQVAEIVADQGRMCIVNEVSLEVGQFAGVEVPLLELAFRDLSPDQLGAQVRLKVESVPIKARCQNCGTVSTIEDFRFRCDGCGANRLTIVSGEGVRLIAIEVTDQPVLS